MRMLAVVSVDIARVRERQRRRERVQCTYKILKRHNRLAARLCACLRFLIHSLAFIQYIVWLIWQITAAQKTLANDFHRFYISPCRLHITAAQYVYLHNLHVCECVKDMRKSWQNQLEIKFEWMEHAYAPYIKKKPL